MSEPSEKPQNCTHPVPQNDYGVFAMHCSDNSPLPDGEIKKVLDGPYAAKQPALTQELAKTGEETGPQN